MGVGVEPLRAEPGPSLTPQVVRPMTASCLDLISFNNNFLGCPLTLPCRIHVKPLLHLSHEYSD